MVVVVALFTKNDAAATAKCTRTEAYKHRDFLLVHSVSSLHSVAADTGNASLDRASLRHDLMSRG